jgi:hypothetical protein
MRMSREWTEAELAAETDKAEAWLDRMERDGTFDPTVIPAELRRVAVAQQDLLAAQQELTAAVRAAHDSGLSWTRLAPWLGVSRQAARQRFGVRRPA